MENKSKQSAYQHVLKYTSIFGGIQGLNILVSIVRTKLVAVILGPDGMGLMSLFSSTIKFVSDSTNLGIGTSAVRDMSEAFEKNDTKVDETVITVRTWSFLTALAGTLLCIVLSPLLNRFTFSWGDHILHFILLSPVVGMTAITSGELSILKGARKLKSLAKVSIYGVFLSVLISIPILYLMGQRGIIPSLLLLTFVQMLLVIGYSIRLYPYRLSFKKSSINKGMSMVRLGVAFVIAGVMGSGADFIIRSYLNYTDSLDAVGLYNAGYMMTMVYAGMVFSAMETDFFPRLSAVNKDVAASNLTINRQIEVSLLILSPMLVALIIALPIIIPLLYSGKFMPVLDMVQIATLALYLRAVNLPVQYLSLAKGDSLSYMFLEVIYDVPIVLLIILLYGDFGLKGIGFALLICSIVDFIVTIIYTHKKYHFSLSRQVVSYMMLQIPIGIAVYIVTQTLQGWSYWTMGGLLLVASTGISLQILQQKTALWNSLKRKFKGGSDE